MSTSPRSLKRPLGLLAAAAVAIAGVIIQPPAALAAESEWNPAAGYTSSDQGDGTYTVPLLNADTPDISVIRVPAAEHDEGRDVYYMMSTTMHLSPGAPVMKSYDLVNWHIVNYVFNRANVADSFSLRNGANSYGQGQWATSFRYHEGRFYVLFNTNNLGGAFIYSTDDVENGVWDRIALGRGFHDPSLFFDEANGGTPYIFYGSGQISAVQLSADLTQVVAEYPQIIRPADYAGASYIGGLFEGVQMFYIDGEYYAVTITWPSGQGRQVVLFRSGDLLGRYATDDGSNPYVARSGLNSNGFAQGSLVPIERADGDTDWWGMFFRDTFPIGRIPALIPAVWEDGWPTFGNSGSVPVGGSFEKPIELTAAESLLEKQRSIVISDYFDNDAEHKAYMDEMWEIPAAPDIDESLLGIELLENPGFEDGTDGWIMNGGGSLQISSDAASGDNAVLATGRTTTGSGPMQDVSGSVQHGVTYAVSTRVRYDNPQSPATKQFFITAHYGGGSYTNLASGTLTRGQWGTISGTFTVPAGQSLSTMRIFVETPWVTEATIAASPADHVMDMLVDDVSLVGQPLTVEYAHPDEIAPTSSRLDMRWQWNHAPDNRYWSLTDREGWLRLTNGKVVTGDYVYTKLANRAELTHFEESRNMLSQRTFGPRASAETLMDISGLADGDVAGLAAYNRGFSYVAVKRVDGVNTLGVVNRSQPFPVTFDQSQAEQFVPGTTVALGDATEVHVKADADFANPVGQLWTTFSYSLDGETWTQLGSRVGPQTLDGSLAHFMGHRFGLFSYATEQTGGSVDFAHYLLSDALGVTGAAVDTASLEAAIDHAETLNQADYPAADWQRMIDALDRAEAILASGVGTQNQADAPERALSLELARLGVIAESAEPELRLDVEADTRCVAGRVLVTIRVTNEEDAPIAVSATSAFGTKSFAAVESGRAAFHAFTTRVASVEADSITVDVSASVGGDNRSTTVDAPYDSRSCS